MPWIKTKPELMAGRKGHDAARAGKPCAPSEAWGVELRKAYRSAYEKTIVRMAEEEALTRALWDSKL